MTCTHPKTFTLKTLCQFSSPCQDVPLGAIAALFMSTPTCQSREEESGVRFSAQTRHSTQRTRTGRGNGGRPGALGARSKLAHLAPRLVHSVAQAFDLVELGYVRREGDQVLLADDLRDLLRGAIQSLLIHIRYRDLEPDPAQCESDLIETPMHTTRRGLEYTHFASSMAAARPMPLAAPVITATRPS